MTYHKLLIKVVKSHYLLVMGHMGREKEIELLLKKFREQLVNWINRASGCFYLL